MPTVDVNAATNNGGWRPLHCAAGNGDRDIVELLLAVPNVDVNVAGNDGQTPLHWAARNRRRAVVEQLLAVPTLM